MILFAFSFPSHFISLSLFVFGPAQPSISPSLFQPAQPNSPSPPPLPFPSPHGIIPARPSSPTLPRPASARLPRLSLPLSLSLTSWLTRKLLISPPAACLPPHSVRATGCPSPHARSPPSLPRRSLTRISDEPPHCNIPDFSRNVRESKKVNFKNI